VSNYRHALADPEELLRRQHFYASAIDQAAGIHRVFELARKNSLPALEQAQEVARGIAASPPRHDSQKALAHYLRENVISKIARKTRYDDVFWCCLLHILDAEGVPECTIGGPLHSLIYRVYDDFDPEDVTG
jgi:hypothetical protein